MDKAFQSILCSQNNKQMIRQKNLNFSVSLDTIYKIKITNWKHLYIRNLRYILFV